MEYILFSTLWCAWCATHSALISLTVTNYLRDRLGSKYRFYRLFYNLIAILTLIPLIFYNVGFDDPVLLSWRGAGVIFRWLLAISALLLFVFGAIKYDMLQLIGIRQIKSKNSHSALSQSGDIDTSGVLSLTRHPWYLATILFIWLRCRDISVSTLIINVILTGYIVIGTILEERKLMIEFGDRYGEYKKQVSMLFPVKWVFSKFALKQHGS